MKRTQYYWHLVAVITVSIWGTTFISTKILLIHGLSASGIFFLRFLQAYIGMLVLCHRKIFCNSFKDEMQMVLLGLTGGSAYFLTENNALRFTAAGNVSLEVCTAPLLTILLAFALGEKMSNVRNLLIGSALALLGVFLVIYSTAADFSFHVFGDLLALSSAMLWAFYQLLTNKSTSKYGILFVTRKVFGYGLLSIVMYLLVRPGEIPSLEKLTEPVVWGNLLFLGLVASLLCFLAWNKVMERIGALCSSNYIYLNPVVTFLFSWIFLDEKLSFVSAIGTVAVLSGVYVALQKK